MATRELRKEKKAKPPLTVTHPNVAAQWHPTLNTNLKPEDFTHGSQKKIWWLCGKNSDHIWDAVIYSRTTGGAGCKFCAGIEVEPGKSLLALRPDLAKELHPTKNKNLNPAKLALGSNKRATWICSRDNSHEYTLVVYLRVQGYDCHVCKSLLVVNPELAKQWHPTLNGSLTPRDVYTWSNKRAFWQCPANSLHEWAATINNRMAGKGCPVCTHRPIELVGKRSSRRQGPRDKVVHPLNSLATLHPELSQEWHPTKNTDTPDDVDPGSAKRRYWICREYETHVWLAAIRERAQFGTECPFCANQMVSDTNSLQALYPEIAKEWHPGKNNGLTPDQVIGGSNKPYWWKCPEGPDHEWRATVDARTYSGTGCPCCANQKVSVTNSLQTLYPEIAKELHPEKNKGLTPDKVISGSHRRVWWFCSANPEHEDWITSVKNRTFQGTGCKECHVWPRSFQEIRLAFELLLFLEFNVEDIYERVDGELQVCDIIIRNHRLIVEFDGSRWHDGREDRDVRKTQTLEKMGWMVIRARERPLQTLFSRDVSVPQSRDMKPVADAVLLQIQRILGITIDGLDDYLNLPNAQNVKACEAFIRKFLRLKNKS